METTKQRDTGPELALRALLHRRGYRYRVDVAPLPGIRARADLVFVRLQVAVFVDGCFWHGCPTHGTWPKANADWWRAKIEANRARDRRVDEALRSAGWSVLRVWEHDSADAAADRVVAELEARAPSANT
jgi:DNA mismatch endonuclease (patch repair protein)